MSVILTGLTIRPDDFPDDTVSGGNGDDELEGGVGRSSVEGAGGDDALRGGDGDDFVRGGAGNDVLHGDAGDDLLHGDIGGDALNGGDGEDFLLGGDGDDTLVGGAGFDVASWSDRTQAVSFLISSLGIATSADGAETDRFAGVDQFIGTDFDDTFLIDANYAADTGDFIVITPGFGRDVIVNAGGDVIVDYATTDGGDPALSIFRDGVVVDLAAGTVESVDPALQDFLGDDVLQGVFGLIGTTGRDHFAGTDQNDFLIGGDGFDILEGRDGDDVLASGAGDGQVDGGDGVDMVDYFDADEGVRVNLARDLAFYRGVDALTSIEDAVGSEFNDILIGDEGVNFLAGAGGADKINGRSGDDILQGGLGDDVYWVDSAGDQVFEAAGEGRDRINTTVDFFNAENVESLVGRFADHGLKLIGNASGEVIFGADVAESGDRVDGVGGNDVVKGFAGDDFLNGGGGDDLLYGGRGDDALRGGLGADRSVGGLGTDRFIHRPGDGFDRIGHFDPTEDAIDLTAHGLDVDGLTAALSEDARGVLADFGANGAVLVYGVALADFGPDTILI